MSDRVTRLMLLNGLVWLVAAVLGVTLNFASNWRPNTDAGQVMCATASLVMSVGVLVLWRRYVRWTGKRITSTVALTALFIAQLVVWKPIWGSTSCGIQDYLLFGQHWTAAGIWCIAC